MADSWTIPTVGPDDWCGEHPSFPAYIASLAAEPEAARLQRELREATEHVERVIAEKDHRHDRP